MSKKLTSIFVAIVFAASVLAQAPQKMSYQAVIRNSSGSLIVNTQVGMQISILQNSATGTAVFVETQKPTTNASGLISIEIGNGTAVKGGMDTIDWGKGPYFLKTETDPAGGTNYTISGTSQLLSVPYALNAGNGGFSHFKVFSSTTTATIPSGVTKIMVEVWGAGGAGSGTSGSGNGGSGGGAGGYGKDIFSVLPGDQYQVTVGAGGTGVADAAGNDGSGSSFGALISASGGSGAARGNGQGGGGKCFAPFNVHGGSGSNGGNSNFPGGGGSAGGGGGSGSPGGGDPGNSPGGGGSGTGVDGTAGGNGGSGLVVVWW